MTSDWFLAATAGTSAGGAARQVNWGSTPLGPTSSWPGSLRSAATLCFSTRFPVMVSWGPDLTLLYNDGYEAMLGTEKRRWAMGSPARVVWAEIWDQIGPLFQEVLDTGAPTWTVDAPLFVNRSAFREEAYFTFSYSPLRDESGAVAGVFDIASETTDQVVDRRRLGTLGELSTTLHALSGDVVELLHASADVLARSPDVVGADLYLWNGSAAEHVAWTGPGEADGRASPATVETTLRHRESWIVGETLLAPLTGSQSAEVLGVIALEAAPERPFDEAYRSFFQLVASTIGMAVAGMLEHRHEVDQLRVVSDALQEAMLPARPTADGWFTRYRPADGTLAVGGDWYDVVDLGDGRWGLLVGDCVGHGLSAAALMGQLRSAGRALLLERNSPASTLDGLDRFARTLPGAEYTTVLCGIVDEPSRTITYASAGHPPALRIGRDGTSWLDEVRGVPLTLCLGKRLERTLALDGSDVIVLYTDGLVERRHESLGEGLERLAVTAESILGTRPVEELADALLDSLAAGARDDVALVVYRVGADD